MRTWRKKTKPSSALIQLQSSGEAAIIAYFDALGSREIAHEASIPALSQLTEAATTSDPSGLEENTMTTMEPKSLRLNQNHPNPSSRKMRIQQFLQLAITMMTQKLQHSVFGQA
jgi:hypothetical protein